MSDGGRIVNTIPSRDSVLRRVVDMVRAEAEPATAADLAASLRPLYPRVAVFERQLSGERSHLYVYRNGRYEPDLGGAWWLGSDVPCVHVDRATGRLTAVSGEWADLMRSSARDLVGRPFTDFVQPEARAVAQAMFEAVNEERDVRSEALVTRPDGTTLAIEFRAAVLDGEIEVCYRPIGEMGRGDA
jgi:PAS domain-containing protein